MTPQPRTATTAALDASAAAFAGVVGVGIDLVDLSAFRRLLDAGGSVFLDNAWTEAEQADADGAPERLAARWAGKEAVMKAIQQGLGDVDPLDIEVITLPSGAPQVVLRGEALEAAARIRVSRWHLSMSHEEGWAVAIAVATADTSLGNGPKQ